LEEDLSVRDFAKIAGIAFVVIGLLGFIPGITQSPPPNAPDLAVETAYGWLLGLFPVNILHNLVHLALGAWGLAAARAWDSARMYARGTAIIYAVLAVMGLVPGLDTMFGLAPLFSHDVWLHVLLAVAAAYFGFMAPSRHHAMSGTAARS
jgi:hypothetical protein